MAPVALNEAKERDFGVIYERQESIASFSGVYAERHLKKIGKLVLSHPLVGESISSMN